MATEPVAAGPMFCKDAPREMPPRGRFEKMHNVRHQLIVAFVAVIAASGWASAAQITIQNSGFEVGTTGSVGNWTKTAGHFAVFQPGTLAGITAYPTGVPQGSKVAFSWGGTIVQQTSEVYDPSMVYTLDLFIGNRADVAFGGFDIRLLAGTEEIAQLSAPRAPSVEYLSGTFTQVSLSSSGGALTSMQSMPLLTIELSALGDSDSFFWQTNFDAISLESSPIPLVPEPLAAGSAVSLLCLALRRTRR